MVADVGDGDGPGDGLTHHIAVLVGGLDDIHDGLEVHGLVDLDGLLGLVALGLIGLIGVVDLITIVPGDDDHISHRTHRFCNGGGGEGAGSTGLQRLDDLVDAHHLVHNGYIVGDILAVVGDGDSPGDGLTDLVGILVGSLDDADEGCIVLRQTATDIGLIEVGADGGGVVTHRVVQGGGTVGGGQNGIAGIVGVLSNDGGVQLHLIGDGVGGHAVADGGGVLAQIPGAVVGRGDADHGNTVAHGVGNAVGVGGGGNDAAGLGCQIHSQRIGGAGDDIAAAKDALE